MGKRVIKHATHCLLLSMILMSFCGCKLYEDYEDCPTGLFITVKAYSASGGEELSDQTVSEVMLYVFDENERYLGCVDTKLNLPTPLNFPGYRKFNVVAMGNSQTGGQIITVADGLSSSFVDLTMHTRAAVACDSPNDLFHTKAFFKGDPKARQDVDMNMYRSVGEMNITVRGIAKKIGDTAADYQIVVGETAGRMDFNGNLRSDIRTSSYRPVAAFISNGNLFTDNFNILPCKSGDNLTINILYKGSPFVSDIRKDSQGKDITVAANGKLSVLIDLGQSGDTGNIEVTVVPATWGARIPIWAER